MRGAGGNATRVALAAFTLLILALTLAPTSAQPTRPISLFPSQGTADALANVLLFLPWGMAAATILARPVLAGFALSCLIELVQLGLPSRFTSPADLLFNTLGAAAGVWLMRNPGWWLAPPPARRRRLGAAALVVALLTAVGGPLLFAPAPTRATLWAQWTPQFANMEHYAGRVLDARVAGVPIPSFRIEQPGVREQLRRGERVTVRILAGPAPAGLAPIFNVSDEHGRENLLLGADGEALVLRVRTRAALLRLQQPDYRLEGALRGVTPGENVTLSAWRDRGGWCMAVDQRTQCGFAFSPGHGYALLQYPLPPPLSLVMPPLWLAALLLPAGFWLRGRVALPGAAASVLVLLLVPRLLGTPGAGAAELAGACAGLLAGSLLSRARRGQAVAVASDGGVGVRGNNRCADATNN